MSSMAKPAEIIRTDDWLLSGGKSLQNATVATHGLYVAYVRRLSGLLMVHWPTIGRLSADEQPLAVERLFNRTKANPEPKYARFFESAPAFAKFPSYLRRAAIRAAVGSVSSFLTRYDAWQSNGQGCGEDGHSGRPRKRPDAAPPTFGMPNVWPVLYSANGGAGAMVRIYGAVASLKLWNGSDWVWLKAAVVRKGARHQGPAAGLPKSPTLRFSKGRVVLTCPFQMPKHCRLGNREVVCSVDLGEPPRRGGDCRFRRYGASAGGFRLHDARRPPRQSRSGHSEQGPQDHGRETAQGSRG